MSSALEKRCRCDILFASQQDTATELCYADQAEKNGNECNLRKRTMRYQLKLDHGLTAGALYHDNMNNLCRARRSSRDCHYEKGPASRLDGVIALKSGCEPERVEAMTPRPLHGLRNNEYVPLESRLQIAAADHAARADSPWCTVSNLTMPVF